MQKSFILIIFFIMPFGMGYAQSLWDGETESPFDDPKKMPFEKHDLIQILVIEKSTASARADLRTDKWTRLESRSALEFDTAGFELDTNVNSRLRKDNLGSTLREFDLVITITAEVVEILPNGNLVIEAKKSRKINDEIESIKLTGIVDPTTVVNNTVESKKIADLKIVYEGKGSLGDHQKPGLLGWLLSKFWPF